MHVSVDLYSTRLKLFFNCPASVKKLLFEELLLFLHACCLRVQQVVDDGSEVHLREHENLITLEIFMQLDVALGLLHLLALQLIKHLPCDRVLLHEQSDGVNHNHEVRVDLRPLLYTVLCMLKLVKIVAVFLEEVLDNLDKIPQLVICAVVLVETIVTAERIVS